MTNIIRPAEHGNSRNGWSKTVLTEIGLVEIEAARPRRFVPAHHRQEAATPAEGVDQIVLSLSARGLTTGEISAHLSRCTEPRCRGRRSPKLPIRCWRR